ncbi:MAG: 50S ribosomal protein L3 [Planctomycetaceae bacterium]|jgi:large subunit ribosomal protein L3|nr:50S ribosomal protein L3 [Planctomycetaceae bacterium]
MSIGLLGTKVGMTQLYTNSGEVIPVTVIQAGPCPVLQLKSVEKDGYEAVQIGYGEKKRSRASRSERGHVAKLESKRQKTNTAAGLETLPKADCEPVKQVREFRVPTNSYQVGQILTVDVFVNVLSVDVTSRTKGRGYSGVIKRHNFGGQRASHGVKKCHRHLGSTGCSAYPSRTPKGKRMPGQYGNTNVTIRNQKVVYIDYDKNLLILRGAVPGPNGITVSITPTNYLPAPKANKWKIEVKKEEIAAVE